MLLVLCEKNEVHPGTFAPGCTLANQQTIADYFKLIEYVLAFKSSHKYSFHILIEYQIR